MMQTSVPRLTENPPFPVSFTASFAAFMAFSIIFRWDLVYIYTSTEEYSPALTLSGDSTEKETESTLTGLTFLDLLCAALAEGAADGRGIEPTGAANMGGAGSG